MRGSIGIEVKFKLLGEWSGGDGEEESGGVGSGGEAVERWVNRCRCGKRRGVEFVGAIILSFKYQGFVKVKVT
jgi:hypothetical protein